MSKKQKAVNLRGEPSLPRSVEMTCECGKVFNTSASLTTHLFKKHIRIPDSHISANKESNHLEIQIKNKPRSIGINQEGQDYDFKVKKQKMKQNKLEIKLDNIVQVTSTFRENQNQQRAQSQTQIGLKEHNEGSIDISYLNEDLGKKLAVQSSDLVNPTSVSMQAEGQPLVKMECEPYFDHSQAQTSRQARQAIENINLGSVTNSQKSESMTLKSLPSKIYQCGECHTLFNFTEQLNLHVNLRHDGQYPEGSVVGAFKEQLQNFFRIEANNNLQRGLESYRNYQCGCGNSYTQRSSLEWHIKARHQSTPPKGTIGLHFKKLIRINDEDSIQRQVNSDK